MGITIHYTLITEDYETVLMAIKTAREYALKNQYKVEEINKEVYVSYSQIASPLKWGDPENTKRYLEAKWGGYREEILLQLPEEPPWPWIVVDYPEKGWYTYATPWWMNSKNGEESRLEGVIISIDTAEPFTMAFYNIGGYYVCDDFTKTQAFTADEVTPNTLFHKWICSLLKYLEKNGRWWNFYVHDEAEYYETMDESKITQSFEAVNRLIYGLASALDEVAEKTGMRVDVGGGKVDIRESRKKIAEIYSEDFNSEKTQRQRKPYQSRLDEFYNEKIEWG